ncbi:MAG: hypothetical protein ACYC46_11480 [Acidobacteriaceae bacterium]
MDNITRRSFVSKTVAGVAALGLLGTAEQPAEAQLVWKSTEWKLAKFQDLVKEPARVKQVYDVAQIGGGKFLNNVKNSLNGLSFGFAVPEKQIKIVAALHGPANLLNFDDYIWEKYQVGAWLNVVDPATKKPAVRNPFFESKVIAEKSAASKNPDEHDSIYQDTSVQALQSRGVQFLSCHTAMEEQARILVKHNKLSSKPEEIVQDMLAHTVPNVLVVASMVAAIALLQAEGHYTYITV